MRCCDLVWLACAIDSEGCVTMTTASRGIVTVIVHVTNTCKEYIDRVAELMRSVGVEVVPRCRSFQPHCKPQWQVRVANLESVKRILEAIRPHLIVKATVADVVLRYIELRGERPRSAYTDTELACVQLVRSLNMKGVKDRAI